MPNRCPDHARTTVTVSDQVGVPARDSVNVRRSARQQPRAAVFSITPPLFTVAAPQVTFVCVQISFPCVHNHPFIRKSNGGIRGFLRFLLN
ncbi:unnamed protein product [Thlaspi arvense]|uniref:Uncharacterized protein n=1 Tax=Thlaspi arvense TaxID=13288 RepID=A0AAU9SVI1_THLAR|nr:unnamed protein product [Thlaspi arvense]